MICMTSSIRLAIVIEPRCFIIVKILSEIYYISRPLKYEYVLVVLIKYNFSEFFKAAYTIRLDHKYFPLFFSSCVVINKFFLNYTQHNNYLSLIMHMRVGKVFIAVYIETDQVVYYSKWNKLVKRKTLSISNLRLGR